MKLFKSISSSVKTAAGFITAVAVVAGVGIKVDDWVEAREDGTVQFEQRMLDTMGLILEQVEYINVEQSMQAESIYQLDSLVNCVGGQMLSLNGKVNRVIELEKDKQRMDDDLWIEKMDELLKKNLEEYDLSYPPSLTPLSGYTETTEAKSLQSR